jgi:tetratricopeptide (TPR) repeat protein
MVPGLAGLISAGAALGSTEDLMKLLEQRHCRNCRLQDADLVHANLRDADLSGAQLQRANLAQAKLDGARLNGTDLSFTSLMGASLRGADLRGARLNGTDLRQSDLSGALFDPGALAQSHWQQARGINPEQLSFVDLHNAGVEAATQGRQSEAEQYFNAAIRREPAAAISWVARGITRGQQGKVDLAANDFNYAAKLYEQGGEPSQAEQLRAAAKQMGQPGQQQSGNGFGSQVLNGLISAFGALAPLAIKAAGMGMGFGI